MYLSLLRSRLNISSSFNHDQHGQLEETDGKLENHVKIMRRTLFIFTIIR